MIRNISSGNKVIFQFSKRFVVDLDALNVVAGKKEHILCPCSYSEQNGKHRIEFEVCAVGNLLEKKELLIPEEFVQSCLKLLEVAQKYDLNLLNFQIKSQYIFKMQEGYQFIYLPVCNKREITYKRFTEKLLRHFKRKDQRISELIKHIKRKSTDTEVITYLKQYSAMEIQEIIEKTEGETTLLRQEKMEEETTLLGQEKTEEAEAENEGETTILVHEATEFFPCESSECETTVLSDNIIFVSEKNTITDGRYNLFLYRSSSGEKIHINKPIYSIGKDINSMDYVLGNASVSRNHATIYVEDDKFYIADNDSTNGTTIEGIRLQKGERAELDDGDIISLGNEVFQVLLEKKEL